MPYFRQDFLLRQIEDAIARAVRFAFKSGEPAQTLVEQDFDDQTRDLRLQLTSQLDRGALGEAEDLLFSHLRPGDLSTLALALWFYERLNALSDEALAAGDFSREELAMGLRDVSAMFGVPG
jgi:hypothetical protein